MGFAVHSIVFMIATRPPPGLRFPKLCPHGRPYAPWALVGPDVPLWAPLGSYRLPWALMGWALVGPLDPRVPSGPLLAHFGSGGPGPFGPPWALMGRALIGSLGIYLHMYIYIYIFMIPACGP